MRIPEDEDLERIKRLKLEKLMKGSGRSEVTIAPQIGKPVDLTDETFNRFVQENEKSVIDMWAPWCGPCRFVSPVIEAIAKDYIGKISFGKVNVDQNQRIASQHHIMSIPTLMVFKGGQLVDRIVGAMPRQMLEPRILSAFG